MAGTSWDKLGLMDAAFEVVGPAIRRVAQDEGVSLQEFHNEDPIWRLGFAREVGGEARVDVTWDEARPESYAVRALWWVDDYDTTMRRSHEEEVGEFTRERPPQELEDLLRQALARVDGWSEAQLDRESGPNPDWQRYQSRDEFMRIRLPKR
jgi:hypothetical protein